MPEKRWGEQEDTLRRNWAQYLDPQIVLSHLRMNEMFNHIMELKIMRGGLGECRPPAVATNCVKNQRLKKNRMCALFLKRFAMRTAYFSSKNRGTLSSRILDNVKNTLFQWKRQKIHAKICVIKHNYSWKPRIIKKSPYFFQRKSQQTGSTSSGNSGMFVAEPIAWCATSENTNKIIGGKCWDKIISRMISLVICEYEIKGGAEIDEIDRQGVPGVRQKCRFWHSNNWTFLSTVSVFFCFAQVWATFWFGQWGEEREHIDVWFCLVATNGRMFMGQERKMVWTPKKRQKLEFSFFFATFFFQLLLVPSNCTLIQ